MRQALAAILVFASTLAFPALGQVKARQGDPAKDEEVTRFHSPMVLEVPLAVADRSLWNAGEIRTDNEVGMRKYTCDGISFVDFALSAVRSRDHNVRIAFHSLLTNEPGVDKRVTLRFEILHDGEVLGVIAARGISVEEGKNASNESSLLISEKALGGAQAPSLRITMSVVENR